MPSPTLRPCWDVLYLIYYGENRLISSRSIWYTISYSIKCLLFGRTSLGKFRQSAPVPPYVYTNTGHIRTNVKICPDIVYSLIWTFSGKFRQIAPAPPYKMLEWNWGSYVIHSWSITITRVKEMAMSLQSLNADVLCHLMTYLEPVDRLNLVLSGMLMDLQL